MHERELLQLERPYSVKATAVVTGNHSHSALWLLQVCVSSVRQVDDDILYTSVSQICKVWQGKTVIILLPLSELLFVASMIQTIPV